MSVVSQVFGSRCWFLSLIPGPPGGGTLTGLLISECFVEMSTR